MTQTEWVLNELKKGPITPIHALSQGGIMRLAARIQELRDSGHEIKTHKIDMNGKSFAQYVLEGKRNA